MRAPLVPSLLYPRAFAHGKHSAVAKDPQQHHYEWCRYILCLSHTDVVSNLMVVPWPHEPQCMAAYAR